MVLYAMVAGFLPFEEHKNTESENLFKFYSYVVNGKLQFPPKMSNALKDLLKLMLNPNPNHRPSISHIVTHPWITQSS